MEETDIRSLLEQSAKLSSAQVFEGYARNDKNLPDNLLIVESPQVIYSFSKSDIVREEQIGGSQSDANAEEQEEQGVQGEQEEQKEQFRGRRIRVWVRAGAPAFRTTPFTPREPSSSFRVGMEHIAPPEPEQIPGMPAAAPEARGVAPMEHLAPPASQEVPGMPAVAAPAVNGAEAMEHIAPPEPEQIPGMPAAAPETRRSTLVRPPLSWVGANWMNSCAGGDRFDNNCAHFLSDAFIRAGYTELTNYGARCYTWESGLSGLGKCGPGLTQWR